MIKFYWNGIKENGGKIQRAFYSMGKLINFPEGTITIYERGYSGFSKDVCELFVVKNDTEIQTDYIVGDVIRVTPSHPLYLSVLKAFQEQELHRQSIRNRKTA